MRAAAVTCSTQSPSTGGWPSWRARLAIEGAGDYDLIGRPVMHDCLARLQAPCHGHVECVSRVLLHGARPERRAAGVTRLGKDLYAVTAYSCISILRCRATAVSSERLCVLHARCWNTRNSRAGASMSWLSSIRCRREHLRAMDCVEQRAGAT